MVRQGGSDTADRAYSRQLAKESERGYAREDDIVQEAVRKGIQATDAQKALETLRRNNSVYAKGGAGTYAPLSQ